MGLIEWFAWFFFGDIFIAVFAGIIRNHISQKATCSEKAGGLFAH